MLALPDGVSQFEVRTGKAVGDHTALTALFYTALCATDREIASGFGPISAGSRRYSRSSQAGDLRLAAIACWMHAFNSSLKGST
jgi:hypothetical protein